MLSLRRMMSATGLSGLAILVQAAAAAASVEIQDGKLQAISSAGIAESTIDFSGSSTTPGTAVLSLSSTSTLKLSFSVQDSSRVAYSSLILSTLSPDALTASLTVSSNNNVKSAKAKTAAASTPVLQDQSLHRANAQVTSVSIYLAPKKAGKFRWEWDLSTTAREDIVNLAKLGQGSLKAQIFLSPTTESGLEATLQEIGRVHIVDAGFLNKKVVRKYPREWEMERYSAREELSWTFREPRKLVGSAKAFFGLALVLSPWILLAALTSQILPSLSIVLPPSSLPFLGLLTLLEASTISYWFGAITVWTFMPLVAGVGFAALLSGKKALSDRMEVRIKGESREKEIEKMQ